MGLFLARELIISIIKHLKCQRRPVNQVCFYILLDVPQITCNAFCQIILVEIVICHIDLSGFRFVFAMRLK